MIAFEFPVVGTLQAAMITGLTGRIPLMPGGMLHAVRVTGMAGDRHFRNASIEWELCDEGGLVHGHMTKPSFRDLPVDYLEYLMIIDPAIPDKNAAHPYWLYWDASGEVTMRTITSFHRPDR